MNGTNGYVALSMAALGGVTAFYLWTSRINQFFFFGRTVSGEFRASSAAEEILRQYRRRIWRGLCASIGLLVFLVLLGKINVGISFEISLVLMAICVNVSFARAHGATGEVGENYAAAEASEHTTSEGRTMAVPLLETSHPSFVFAVLLPLLAAAGAWLGSMAVARLGFSSFADAAGHDGSASFLTGLGVGLLFGDALFYVQLRFFSRHRSPLALFAGRSCMMMGWLGAAAIGVCALSVPLHFEITHERMRMLLLVVLAVVALRVVYAWTRKSLYTPHQAERHGDEFWRWGLFYYNPGDPVLLVQNRCRPGYTLNFANFLAWPIALGLVGDLVFLFVMQLRR